MVVLVKMVEEWIIFTIYIHHIRPIVIIIIIFIIIIVIIMPLQASKASHYHMQKVMTMKMMQKQIREELEVVLSFVMKTF